MTDDNSEHVCFDLNDPDQVWEAMRHMSRYANNPIVSTTQAAIELAFSVKYRTMLPSSTARQLCQCSGARVVCAGIMQVDTNVSASICAEHGVAHICDIHCNIFNPNVADQGVCPLSGIVRAETMVHENARRVCDSELKTVDDVQSSTRQPSTTRRRRKATITRFAVTQQIEQELRQLVDPSMLANGVFISEQRIHTIAKELYTFLANIEFAYGSALELSAAINALVTLNRTVNDICINNVKVFYGNTFMMRVFTEKGRHDTRAAKNIINHMRKLIKKSSTAASVPYLDFSIYD